MEQLQTFNSDHKDLLRYHEYLWLRATVISLSPVEKQQKIVHPVVLAINFPSVLQRPS